MNRLKVLHIVGTMNLGGQETFIMNMYRNINRANIQFDFIVHGDKKGYYEDEIEKLGGKIYRVSSKTKNIYKYFLDMANLFKSNKYKIVHIHTCSSTIFLDALISKLYGVENIIAHSHNTQSSNGNIIHSICIPLLNKFTDIKLACSKDAAEWLYGKHIIDDVKIIKNSIDSQKYIFNSEVRTMLRKKMNLENKFIIGHVGRFHKQKNHIMLIEIFNEILMKRDDAVLILVGEGELQDEIKLLVDKMGIREQVKFLGIRDDVYNIMQIMDVFVFPSLYEGLGIVAIEAQASGLPVFMSSNLPDDLNITDLVNRISIQSSEKEWAKKIIDVKYERHNMFEEIIHAGYDIKLNAKYLEELYIKLES